MRERGIDDLDLAAAEENEESVTLEKCERKSDPARIELITCWPCAPSLLSASSLGKITVHNCRIIDALIYGERPRSTTEKFLRAPPVSAAKIPNGPVLARWERN